MSTERTNMKVTIAFILVVVVMLNPLFAQDLADTESPRGKIELTNNTRQVMDGSTTIRMKPGETESFTDVKIGGNRSVYYYEQKKLSIPAGVSFSRDGSPYGNIFGTYVDFTISVDDSVSAGEYRLLVRYQWFNAPVNGSLVYSDTLTINLTVYLYDPPVADFEADSTEITEGDAVTFTNASTGTITDVEWAFGDASTSTLENPTHIYEQPGRYTVQLTTNGPAGTDTKIKNDYITVNYREPVADFTATPASGIVPLVVQFSDQSTGTIENRLWTFGDGDTSSVENPEHVYETPGTYTVELTVSNPAGTHSTSDSIVVQFPTGIAQNESIPADYELYPNFPNPFNPSTTIACALPRASHITLSVFDVSGRTIATLVQGQLNAGHHTITWNAAAHPSGTYFIKLAADEATRIQKCLLVR